MALTFDPLEQVLQLEQFNVAVSMSRYALARVVFSIVTPVTRRLSDLSLNPPVPSSTRPSYTLRPCFLGFY